MDTNTTNPSIATLPQPKWAFRFFTIWTGQAFSLLGSQLVQFALVWWLTASTGSATVLATATLVALLPQIFLGPLAGAWVDRHNRRWIMIIADSSIALVTLGLIVLFAIGKVQVWHVFVAMLLRSLGGAFHSPAMGASTTLLVPDKHLARVAGMNQTLQGVMSIFAPPLGALLISVFPTQGVLAIDIITAAMAVIPLFLFSIPNPPQIDAAKEGGHKKSFWADLRDGFTYVVKWPGLLGLILLAMLLNFLLVPSSSLLPLVVKSVFQKGAPELALTESIFGIGIILGGILLSVWGGFKRRIITSMVGILGIGVGIFCVGLIPQNLFWVFLAAGFVIGFAQVFANGPLSAIMQGTVEPAFQGRVFSLLGAGATAMMPLSLLVAGPISDWLGVRFWFLIGGGLVILVTIIAFFIKPIMEIEKNHGKPEA